MDGVDASVATSVNSSDDVRLLAGETRSASLKLRETYRSFAVEK